MIIDDDNLALVEEIYLTQKRYIRWMCSNPPRPDIFSIREGKVALKNMNAQAQVPKKAPGPSELQLMVRRAFGPSTNASNVVPPAPVPQPKPARKLERPGDAVWTFFLDGCLVIGVHDDGTVVARYALNWCPTYEYRVTPDGALFHCRRLVEGAELASQPTESVAKHLRDALKEWVKREEGRKMPPGIQRLIKRIAEARKVWPIPDWRTACLPRTERPEMKPFVDGPQPPLRAICHAGITVKVISEW